MLMIPAGKLVDDVIETLIAFLDAGDIILDGGNSHFSDTSRRTRMLEDKGLLYVGAGVFGGEEGALLGPSIMPGGSGAAWTSVGPIFAETIAQSQLSLRKVLGEAIKNGIPTPAMSSALAYYDGYRSANLPANLLQAQRDYFVAHQYERVDRPRGKYFQSNWIGRGGETAFTVYSA